MTCTNCGQQINKGDMKCTSCGSDQLVRKGLFGWTLLGFIGGLFIPSLIDFIAVLFLSDKRVAEDFLNPTIIGRSRWAAARRGLIVGAITQVLLIVALLVFIFGGLYWIYTGLGC